MFRFLLSVLYDVDLFKAPFLLRFKNRKKSSTYVGSFVSLLIFTTVLVSLFQSDVIQKRSPKVVEKVVSTYSPANPGSPSITIDGNFSYFPFAYGVSDLNRNLVEDPTIFTLEVFYKVQIATNWTEYPVYSRPCTEEESDLKGFDYSRSHCVPRGSLFVIQGSPQEEVFSTLVFALRICNSETDNVTCQSPEAIQAYMLDKYFYVAYADHTYDVDNYEAPINDEYKLKKTRASTSQSTFVGTFYQKAIFQSDDNSILTNYKEKEFFTKYSDELDLQPLQGDQFMYMNAHNRYLITYYFGTTQSIRTVTRTYQKLQEALANVAGISNILIFIGFILTGFQSRINMVSKIIQILFVLRKQKRRAKERERKNAKSKGTLNKFAMEDPKDPNAIKSAAQLQTQKDEDKNLTTIENAIPKQNDDFKISVSPIRIRDLLIEMNSNTPLSRKNLLYSPNIKQTPIDTPQIHKKIEKDEVLQSKNIINTSNNLIVLNTVLDTNQRSSRFQKYCNRDQKYKQLKITPLRYLKAQFKKKLRRPLNDNEKSILMAEEIYNDEIDIITILFKLQEIDKLKKILLSEDQIALFNLLDKPKIYPELKTNKDNSWNQNPSNMPKKKHEENVSQNVRIYEQMIAKMEKTKVERRLLQLLEKDVEEFDQAE